MKQQLQKIVLALLMIAAIASEAFLLYQNNELKEQLNISTHRGRDVLRLQMLYDQFLEERNLEGAALPFLASNEFTFQANGVARIPNSKFYLMLCFSIYDCGSCVSNQIFALSKFAALYDPEICQVFVVTDTLGMGNMDEFRRSSHMKFPVIDIPGLSDRLAESGIKKAPVVLFGEGVSKKVIYAHFPTPEDDTGESFYKKLHSILDSYQE